MAGEAMPFTALGSQTWVDAAGQGSGSAQHSGARLGHTLAAEWQPTLCPQTQERPLSSSCHPVLGPAAGAQLGACPSAGQGVVLVSLRRHRAFFVN